MYSDPKCFLNFIEGAILGFATADALGVPVEFTSREERREDPVYEMRSGGAHGQPAGTWSDDTSMTLCMIHSLIEKGIDYEDQMARFADWMVNGNYTARGDVFDIGGATHRAISKHLRGKPALECGDEADSVCGNGSLMRIMPLAFYLEGKYGNWKLDKRTAEIIHKASDCILLPVSRRKSRELLFSGAFSCWLCTRTILNRTRIKLYSLLPFR